MRTSCLPDLMDTQVFFEKLRKNPHPLIVDLWAPWCIPCRTIKPSLEKLAQEYAGQVDLWQINADENQDLVRDLKVYGIPTLIAYDRDQEMARFVGAKPVNELKALFEGLSKGNVLVPNGLSSQDRLIRLLAGSAVAGMAWVNSLHWSLFVFGGMLIFSAVYDRCPIWKALTAQFRKIGAR